VPLLPALESCVGLFAADRPHAAPALAEGPREGRGLRGEMVPHAQAAAAQRHAPARSRRPAGCRRKRLVTRNRDNGARSLPCRHVRQPSRPASHLASPAAKIGKFPTALIRSEISRAEDRPCRRVSGVRNRASRSGMQGRKGAFVVSSTSRRPYQQAAHRIPTKYQQFVCSGLGSHVPV